MPFPFTDIIVCILLIQCLVAGWHRGVLRAAIGPLCFTISCIAGIISFDLSGNIIKACTLTAVGTVVLTVVGTILMLLGRATVEKQYRGYVFWPSRVLGSILTLLWQGLITAAIILLLTLFPTGKGTFKIVQDDIIRSYAYRWVNLNIVEKNTTLRNLITSFSIFKNPREILRYSSTEEFGDFFFDPKIVSLYSDPKFLYNLNTGNYAQFMTDPDIKAIIHDDELMRKFTKLTKRIYAGKFPAEEQAPDEESTP